MDDLRTKIEHELDELMMAAENYFGAVNPKRNGHLHCALDRIMALLNAPSGSSSEKSQIATAAELEAMLNSEDDRPIKINPDGSISPIT